MKIILNQLSTKKHMIFKPIMALIILVITLISVSIPSYAKMSSNSKFPSNIMKDTWTTPTLAYAGRYVTSNTISNITNASKVIAFYIPLTSEDNITLTVTDSNNVSRNYTNTDFVTYPALLKDTAENTYPVSIIYTDIVPLKIIFTVTVENITQSGADTWKNNIQANSYLSVSSLYNINAVTQQMLDEALDEAYKTGYHDALQEYAVYKDGLYLGYNFPPGWYSADFMEELAMDYWTAYGLAEGQQMANNSNLAILTFIPSIIGSLGSFFLTLASFEFLGISVLGVLIIMSSLGAVLLVLKFIRG